MAKLTRKQRQHIEAALAAVNRLNAFIESERIVVCRLQSVNVETAHGPNDFRARDIHETKRYIGRDGTEWDISYIKEMSPIDKGIGSDLVARYDIKKSLERLLEE